ncbi:molybdenum cofactor guanylyltransferase MobA [Magnetofaba australis]|uniref:Molybdenum cofactor guanylyltransferase n=1 Tax=Magnetofaba australis IT-1 TaxID=1434232 RepID=A0A1Y2K8B4_9PROT|nr:molybdenum cofactor guanylyltransferase MobA [Magnetofaba australis]OSM07000.1 putative molybdopterin-guanine dinucleotide biosynthesis protein A [Magnetofaba australis IT-1]
MADSATICAVVLAGGRGQRMGGRDKGLIPWRGKPLALHVLERLRGQSHSALISANRHTAEYARWGAPVVVDDGGPYGGALCGVLSALSHTPADWLLTAPCDAPLLPLDLAQRLLRARAESGALMAIAHDGTRPQPAFALIHRDLERPLQACLHSGEKRLNGWARQVNAAHADFSDCPAAFTNVNDPEQFAQLEQIADQL